MRNPIIPQKNLDDLARKFGLGSYATGKEEETENNDSPEMSVKKEGDNFIFTNLPYSNGILSEVKLYGKLLANGAKKKHPDWITYSQSNRTAGVICNSIAIYQMARILYRLRESGNEAIEECIALFREDWSTHYPHTGSKVGYRAEVESAAIEHVQIDGTVSSKIVEIPEFTRFDDNWSYLTLAPEQPESDLGNVEEIAGNAEPVLEALLGKGYEEVGEVFQYLSPRKNGNLREVRLWTPTLTNRTTERAVVLGVSNINGNFYIVANDDLGNERPARGVVVVEEAP